MLNRETNTDILGIYKKTSEGVLKFSYFGEVHNGTTQLHSLPSVYNRTYTNTMILHSGDTGVGTDISVDPITSFSGWTTSMTMKRFSTIAAIPNYVNVSSVASISKSLLSAVSTNQGYEYNLMCSILVKIGDISVLTGSEGVLIVDSTPNSTQVSFLDANTTKNGFKHLGDNIYALSIGNTINFSNSSITEIRLPYAALAKFDSNGNFVVSDSTTFEYLDACIIADAK